MTTQRKQADVESLEKLLLGQLPVVEAERLAVECADDSRVPEVAEALAGRDDTLLDSLRNHQTETDSQVDDLAARLIQDLKAPAASQASSSGTLPLSDEVPPTPQPLPERLEYFRIEKVLGEGGMGTVYLAEDTRLGRRVALKTLKRDLAIKPAAKDRFLREARSAAKLEHDHVIPIHYVGEADGTPFLAMPFLQGEPLDRRIEREKAAGTLLPVDESMRIARQIATGLAFAHDKGLIHRDIKPANIWLEAPTGRVKILDFGLARTQQDDAHLTASGTIIGTPSYMAPEQGRGLAVDHRADLFSLGCVLYEMLTGNRPFTGRDTMAVLTALAIDTPQMPHELNPKCPLALSRLTMQLLEKQPDERPASAKVVVDELAKMEVPAADATAVMSAPTPVAAKRQPETVPYGPSGGKRRYLIPTLVAAVLLLVPFGWWVATTVLRVETPDGTLIVEMDDAEVEARIKNGKVVLYGPDDKVRYTLTASDRNKKLDAGPYKIRVEGADGLVLDTNEFTMKKGDKVTVRVTVDPKSLAKNLDADRKAAEYVLSIGGIVQVNDQGDDIKAVADLPKGPFRLTSFTLNENKRVNDAGLASFKGCVNLAVLRLEGTQVTDEGMTYFKDCKNLRELGLRRTRVSDVGLANFKDCKNLAILALDFTGVTDAGLAIFKECKELKSLFVISTQVSDAGLALVKDCKKLVFLNLDSTKVTDAGLTLLKECQSVQMFTLRGTQVSDAGLVHLKDYKNLNFLWLDNSQVSNAGLIHLVACKKLEVLNLSGPKISDAGMIHVKECKNLKDLAVWHSKVGDKGLAHIKELKKLTTLILRDTQVTDEGLVHLKECKQLTYINLRVTKASNKGIEELKKALPTCKIEWDGGTIEPTPK